jgi:transposase
MGRIRRKFSVDFKQQVVREIEAGLSLNEAARHHQIDPSVLSHWRNKYRQGALVEKPSPHEKALEKENEKLKAKIGELVMEIDILKKFQKYMEKQKKLDTSVITAKNLDQFRKDVE